MLQKGCFFGVLGAVGGFPVAIISKERNEGRVGVAESAGTTANSGKEERPSGTIENWRNKTHFSPQGKGRGGCPAQGNESRRQKEKKHRVP